MSCLLLRPYGDPGPEPVDVRMYVWPRGDADLLCAQRKAQWMTDQS